MRDCKNCKHLIMYDYKNKSYSCEKWECKFEPKEQEPTTKKDLGVDCISRAEMLKYQEYLHGKMSNEENHKLWEFIKDLPSVTPQEPKTGHWISRWHAGHAFHFHVCSECNEEFSCDMETGISIDNYRYCPNCGAKMAESEDT